MRDKSLKSSSVEARHSRLAEIMKKGPEILKLKTREERLKALDKLVSKPKKSQTSE